MKGKNLVTKALKGFNQAKALLERAITADTVAIENIAIQIDDLATTKISHEDNMKYAKNVLSKLDALLA